MKHIIVVDDDGSSRPRSGRSRSRLDQSDRVEHIDIYPSEAAETPSVLHYTSGTTGKPKGRSMYTTR